jgi:RimJ/RimL family protein N-acetyltransferase
MTSHDAAFILALLNEPPFLRYIGLFLVELKSDATPIGMCGLLKRASMQDVEVGFAFLSRFCAQGFATEAAIAVMKLGRETFALTRIVAITDPDNDGSAKVLKKIGFADSGMIRLPEFAAASRLFVAEAAA